MYKDSRIQNKKFDFSYTMGVSPTLELLKHKRQSVKKVYLSTRSNKNQGARDIVNLCKKHKIPFEISDKMVGKLSPKENSLVVGLFDKYETKLAPEKNHIMLSGVRDMGNMGTIIRTMVAFGYTDLAIIKPSVHLFDPKVVRSSMGELFGIRFEYFDDFDAYFKEHSNHDVVSFAADSKNSANQVRATNPHTILFTDDLLAPAGFRGQHFGIKTSNNTPLNISVAVGIALYSLS